MHFDREVRTVVTHVKGQMGLGVVQVQNGHCDMGESVGEVKQSH